MIIHNPILTGSFTVNGTDVASITSSAASITALNAATASLNSFSASVLTFTSSAATRLGALEAATASLYTATSSFSGRVGALETYTSSLNNKTSSFATTGSNTFIGTQTISGSVLQSGSFTSTGTLTAQTLVIQTITSSVVYSSGSNIFGNDVANSQTFTGSVNITGSLSLNSITIPTSASLASTYLQLAGGTLTGTLGGTSASFSGTMNADSYGIAGAVQAITWTTNTLRLGQGTYWQNIELWANGSSKLTIASTGAATISAPTTDYALTVNGTALWYTARFIGSATTGQSYGPSITAGTNSSDQSFIVQNKAATSNYFVVRGDGNVGIGTSSPLGLLQLFGAEVAAYKTYTGQGNTGGGDAIINAYRLDGASNYLRVTDIVALGDDTNNRGSSIRLMVTNTSGVTSTALTLASTGAATFSGALSGTSATFSMPSGNGALTIANSSLSGKNWTFLPNTNGAESDLLLYYAGASAGTRLTIASTGEATFSSSVTATSLNTNRPSSTTSNPLIWNTAGVSDWFLGSSPLGTSTSDLSLYSYGTSSVVLNIVRSTGAATFSSSVTAGGDVSIINTGGNALLQQNGSAASTIGMIMKQGGTEVGRISFPATTSMTFSVGSSVTTALTIASTGAATFSSSVTASSTKAVKLLPAQSAAVGLPAGSAISSTGNFSIYSDSGVSGETQGLYYWNGSTYYAALQTSNVASGFSNLLLAKDGGNVGIGTSSPQATYKVTISGTDTIFPAIYLENTTNTQAYSIRATGTSFSIRDNTSGNDRITLTNGGNVGIGTSSPTTKLDVVGDSRIQGGGAVSYAVFNLLDNTASGSNWAILSGFPSLGNFTIRESGVANHLIIAKTTGNATFLGSVTATSFFESSDSRLKTLIQDNYQTKGIASITPKLYTKNGKVELGYYAQDLVGILDSAISKSSDDMLSLSYREVLVAKVYALEQRIKELENK